MRATNLVMLVRCLHCSHKSILNERTLAAFGLLPDAPILAFVKRLRCSKSGSILRAVRAFI
jgi:DNA-directed RNA polymerase subunit RPC12/RpoP